MGIIVVDFFVNLLTYDTRVCFIYADLFITITLTVISSVDDENWPKIFEEFCF